MFYFNILMQGKRLHISQEKGELKGSTCVFLRSCFQGIIFILASGKIKKSGQTPDTFDST